jgi:hypothetical protein
MSKAAVGFAKRKMHRAIKQSLYATAAFVLISTTVALFTEGFPLHSYWKPIGRPLICLWDVMLVVFVIFVGRAFNAWICVREMERIEE